MGHVVRVDPDQVAAAAAGLDTVVADLERVAQGAAWAWQAAAHAAGGRELADACTVAGDQGTRLTAGVAGVTGRLAGATRASAQAYREAELLVARVWAGRVDAQTPGASS